MSEPIDAAIVQSALQAILEAAGRTSPPESPVELRQRTGRRGTTRVDPKLLLALAAVVMLVVGLFTAGAIHRSAHQPTTVHRGGSHTFSLRPLLCYAVPYTSLPSAISHPAPAPLICSAQSLLTAANIGVNTNSGIVTNPIPPDGQFAYNPTTPPAEDVAGTTVLLPQFTSAEGSVNRTTPAPTRFILGPADMTGADVATASVQHSQFTWNVLVRLTPIGSTHLDALAQQQFHAFIAIDLDGHVLSAPVIEPTQASFSSFGGEFQISGGFTEAQANAAATAIANSR